jgi:hypothetical protein
VSFFINATHIAAVVARREVSTLSAPAEPLPDHCLLEHQVFTAFGPAMFRRAPTDGVPVMVVPMGGREAMLPLRGLQKEFAIGEDSRDGRMLGLIAESLDFVTSLQIGDRLPAEVLTGEASWEPSQQCRDLVKARLRLQLVAWLNPDAAGAGAAANADALQLLDSDPELRRQVQVAFGRAAQALGVPGAEDVVRLVESLAEELAYIEALRSSLLARVQGLGARLARLGHGLHGDRNRTEMLTQVQRLLANAIKQLGGRFEEVDAQTGEILSALRNAEQQRAFIRSNRDWLYRCQRAWESLLKEWDHAGAVPDESIWQLIATTYQFLAPRYMPVTEWQAYNTAQRDRSARQTAKVMRW